MLNTMSMKATLEIECKSEQEAKNVLFALSQETEFKKRAKSRVIAEGKLIEIMISADDSVALRATLNSYLRLIQVIQGIKANEGE